MKIYIYIYIYEIFILLDKGDSIFALKSLNVTIIDIIVLLGSQSL